MVSSPWWTSSNSVWILTAPLIGKHHVIQWIEKPHAHRSVPKHPVAPLGGPQVVSCQDLDVQDTESLFIDSEPSREGEWVYSSLIPYSSMPLVTTPILMDPTQSVTQSLYGLNINFPGTLLTVCVLGTHQYTVCWCSRDSEILCGMVYTQPHKLSPEYTAVYGEAITISYCQMR